MYEKKYKRKGDMDKRNIVERSKWRGDIQE